MKVAAIQHDIAWEDAERTRKNVTPLIAAAASARSHCAMEPTR